jgi:hypothetical protein
MGRFVGLEVAAGTVTRSREMMVIALGDNECVLLSRLGALAPVHLASPVWHGGCPAWIARSIPCAEAGEQHERQGDWRWERHGVTDQGCDGILI